MSGRTRELFDAEYSRIRNRLIDAGCPDELADEIAAERAYPAMKDKLADLADSLRDLLKEQG